MITPLHPESQKLSSIQIEKDTEQTIREQGETSLQEPVEGARELVTWTMELLTTLAIPLTAQTILPPSAYPNPETRKEVAAFDKWVKQTQSHLGSLNLGLRGCSLIFWSQLLGAKREVLANARTELSKFSKEDSSVKSALEKITSAEEVVRKEEQVYLEQKRSWGLRAFRQSLRITQPYLKELGRAASLTAIAKIANLAFQWTISSLGLLFSGQAFKKALSEWKIYKQGAADFERRLRFPQPTSPLTPQTQSVPNGTQIDEEAWLKKKIADKENIFKEKCNNIVKDWASQQQNIQEACELQKKSAIPEVGRVIFFKKCYTCSDDEASDLNIFFASDLRMDLSLKTPSKTLQSALAKLYVTHQYDQQQTRMHAVKNGLLEMVSAKQKMEGAFLKLKLGDTGSVFTISALQFAVQLALLVLGLATIPFGGAGMIVFWLAVASFAATGAVTLGSTYYTARKRYHRSIEEFQFVNARLFYAELRKKIAQHRLARYSLERPSQQDPTKITMHQNIKKWADTAHSLQERLSQATWKDFAKQHLYQWQKWGKPEEVVLQELSEALQKIDPKQLDPESNQLLRDYFGITNENFVTDPPIIQKKLRHFFTFDHSELVKFMKNQTARPASGAT